jgi:pentapeptide MXKDX repeat protein
MLRSRLSIAAAFLAFAVAANPALAQGMMKDDGMAKDQMSKDATPKTDCKDIMAKDGMAKDAMAKDDCKDEMQKDGMAKDNMMAPPK